ncbi:type II secretion system protein J, partial [Verrucomicrobiota bacterium]
MKAHMHYWARRVRNGFTLVEVMIAVSLFTLVMGGTISVFLMCQRVWHSTSLKIQTTHDANMAMARMVYGLGTNSGLRSASFADVNTNVLGCWVGGSEYPQPAGAGTHFLYTNFGTPNKSWRLTFSNEFDGLHYIDYNKLASNIVY